MLWGAARAVRCFRGQSVVSGELLSSQRPSGKPRRRRMATLCESAGLVAGGPGFCSQASIRPEAAEASPNRAPSSRSGARTQGWAWADGEEVRSGGIRARREKHGQVPAATAKAEVQQAWDPHRRGAAAPASSARQAHKREAALAKQGGCPRRASEHAPKPWTRRRPRRASTPRPRRRRGAETRRRGWAGGAAEPPRVLLL